MKNKTLKTTLVLFGILTVPANAAHGGERLQDIIRRCKELQQQCRGKLDEIRATQIRIKACLSGNKQKYYAQRVGELQARIKGLTAGGGALARIQVQVGDARERALIGAAPGDGLMCCIFSLGENPQEPTIADILQITGTEDGNIQLDVRADAAPNLVEQGAVLDNDVLQLIANERGYNIRLWTQPQRRDGLVSPPVIRRTVISTNPNGETRDIFLQGGVMGGHYVPMALEGDAAGAKRVEKVSALQGASSVRVLAPSSEDELIQADVLQEIEQAEVHERGEREQAAVKGEIEDAIGNYVNEPTMRRRAVLQAVLDNSLERGGQRQALIFGDEAWGEYQARAVTALFAISAPVPTEPVEFAMRAQAASPEVARLNAAQGFPKDGFSDLLSRWRDSTGQLKLVRFIELCILLVRAEQAGAVIKGVDFDHYGDVTNPKLLAKVRVTQDAIGVMVEQQAQSPELTSVYVADYVTEISHPYADTRKQEVPADELTVRARYLNLYNQYALAASSTETPAISFTLRDLLIQAEKLGIVKIGEDFNHYMDVENPKLLAKMREYSGTTGVRAPMVGVETVKARFGVLLFLYDRVETIAPFQHESLTTALFSQLSDLVVRAEGMGIVTRCIDFKHPSNFSDPKLLAKMEVPVARVAVPVQVSRLAPEATAVERPEMDVPVVIAAVPAQVSRLAPEATAVERPESVVPELRPTIRAILPAMLELKQKFQR